MSWVFEQSMQDPKHYLAFPETRHFSAGVVHKESDQDNKKIKHLFLTDEGKELAKVIERENIFSNQMALDGLTQKEKSELKRLLKTVEKNANNNWQFVKKGGKRKY